ncbi:MAG: S8 family peptidase [Actinomycetota bacterium]|nr:S8 family peptidase [Actinomycetota bacterium]
MKRASVLLAGVLAAMFVVCGAVLAQPSKAVGPPDRYIVVLKKGASEPGRAANEMARRYGLGVGFIYSHALEGFSATIPDGRLEKVRADERVDYVERDEVMSAVAQILPWGVDYVQADLSSTKAGNGSGAVSNVHAYVIDTGIDATHTDLNVVDHVNFTGDGNNYDCNGHGTHVAGTLAAKDNATDVVGVAPGAPLIGVKVLGCDATGSASTIIKGIDWVTANAKQPAVANVSLSGPADQSVDDAVRNSAASDILYSVAAGNNNQPACNYSPARAGRTKTIDGTWKKNNGIVTTAATNDKNGEWPSSNFGACVDLWAPGANILSTKLGGDTTTRSGTSMASPHVGGGGALYLHSYTTAKPSSVEGALKDAARRPGTKSGDGRSILLENVGAF